MPATVCIGGSGRSFLFPTESNGRTGRRSERSTVPRRERPLRLPDACRRLGAGLGGLDRLSLNRCAPDASTVTCRRPRPQRAPRRRRRRPQQPERHRPGQAAFVTDRLFAVLQWTRPAHAATRTACESSAVSLLGSGSTPSAATPRAPPPHRLSAGCAGSREADPARLTRGRRGAGTVPPWWQGFPKNS